MKTCKWAAVAAALALAGCGKQGVELGQGGSVVSGSGGSAGAQGAAKELQKCDAPVAVVSLVENQRGYVGIGRGGLPESPLPLVRVLMQQSGCFRIVDRNAGLDATVREQELKDKGVLRADDTTVRKGRGIVAQYSVVPSLTFSEQDAGRQIGGILAQIPFLNKFAGAAEQVKLKEAQVVLLLTDNETTEQLSSATGAARTTDLGVGGLVLGKTGGAGGLGWSNTNEGKVIAAAFLDAHNHLVEQVRVLAAKPLPEPVKTSAAAGRKG
ncbi:MAG: curli production assembly/transport component CsgG [Proteobacteria bacterium]|nr:curli production assembly/transport component CsgG [Pseudomonadota bacterium]